MVGRPAFVISETQLAFLVENRFSVPQIADMIGVSVRTVHRRMSDFGLSIREQYSLMSDTELDRIIESIQREFPTCGNKQMQGQWEQLLGVCIVLIDGNTL